MTGLSVALLVCSDRGASGLRDDQSEAPLRARLSAAGHRLEQVVVVADDALAIEAKLRELAARHAVVLTTGGTGIGPRDVTVEATRRVLDREVPGLGEAMRAASLAVTPMAMLSRATAGVLGECLVVNLPGSPKGAGECLEVVLPVFAHAHRLLRREVKDCQEEVGP